MSYCRFSEADVYIYDDVYYGLICCVCSLMPLRKSAPNKFFPEAIMINDNFIAEYDYDKMLNHVAEHRAVGHYIPEDVDEMLIEERDCEHIFIEMKYGIRCEKCWRPQIESTN